jgi:DNA-binding ferritin-like protein (Dps family)
MEAMVLTFAEAPTRGKSAFEAYGALIDYGTGGGMTKGYEVDGLLKQVLTTGSYDNVEIVDSDRADALKSTDASGRVENAINYLNACIELLEEINSKQLDPQSWRDVVGFVEPVETLTRELMSDMTKAYVDVRSAVQRFATKLQGGKRVGTL